MSPSEISSSRLPAVGSDSIVAMEHCRQQPDRGALFLLEPSQEQEQSVELRFQRQMAVRKGDLFLDLCAKAVEEVKRLAGLGNFHEARPPAVLFTKDPTQSTHQAWLYQPVGL